MSRTIEPTGPIAVGTLEWPEGDAHKAPLFAVDWEDWDGVPQVIAEYGGGREVQSVAAWTLVGQDGVSIPVLVVRFVDPGTNPSDSDQVRGVVAMAVTGTDEDERAALLGAYAQGKVVLTDEPTFNQVPDDGTLDPTLGRRLLILSADGAPLEPKLREWHLLP